MIDASRSDTRGTQHDMDMMGITSSQPATQSQVADTHVEAPEKATTAAAAGPESQEVEQPELSNGKLDRVTNTPPAKIRLSGESRSPRKLKTYSGKKKRLSANRSKMAADDEADEGKDEDIQQTPLAMSSSMPGPENAPQPGSREMGNTRAHGAHGADAIAAADATVAVEGTPVDNSHTDAPPQSTPISNRRSDLRERVSRNRAFLDSIRKPKARKLQQSNDDSSQPQRPTQDSDKNLATPPDTDQISDQVKVSTWLDRGSASGQPPVVDFPPNPYGAPLREQGTSARGRADDDDEVMADQGVHRQYEMPSDSDDVYEPESAQRSTHTKSKSATKAKAKRKRDSTDRHAATPAKKRQRKSEPGAVSPADRPPTNPARLPSSGNFISEEIALVEIAFDDARAALGLTRPEMIHRIQSSHSDIGSMLSTLNQDILPNRNRKSIQRFCRRHFNDAQRGKWTQEQDDMLCAAQSENPNRWVFIGERVGRLPEDCRDRWRNFLSLGDSRHTDVWTREEELTLCRAVRDAVAVVRQQRNEDISPEKEDEYIPWTLVVKAMGGLRNRLQCTNKWKKIRTRSEKQAEPEAYVSDGEKKKEKAASKKRFKQLTMGDVLAMMKEIQYACFIGRIDHGPTFWGVVTKMHPSSPYTTQDRKNAYRRTKEMIEDTGDFADNISAIIHQIERRFPEKLQSRTLHDDPDKQKRSRAHRSTARVQESDDDQANEGADGEDGEDGEEADTARTSEQAIGEEAEQDEILNAGQQHQDVDNEQQVPNSPHISESVYDDEE